MPAHRSVCRGSRARLCSEVARQSAARRIRDTESTVANERSGLGGLVFLLSSRASGRLAAEDHLHFCSPEKALCLHLLLEVFSCRQLLRTALVHVTMGLGQSSAFAPDASGTLLADGSRWGVFDPQKAGKSCSLERVKFDLQAIGHRLLTSVTSIGC